jgi:hypothetical protein
MSASAIVLARWANTSAKLRRDNSNRVYRLSKGCASSRSSNTFSWPSAVVVKTQTLCGGMGLEEAEETPDDCGPESVGLVDDEGPRFGRPLYPGQPRRTNSAAGTVRGMEGSMTVSDQLRAAIKAMVVIVWLPPPVSRGRDFRRRAFTDGNSSAAGCKKPGGVAGCQQDESGLANRELLHFQPGLCEQVHEALAEVLRVARLFHAVHARRSLHDHRSIHGPLTAST